MELKIISLTATLQTDTSRTSELKVIHKIDFLLRHKADGSSEMSSSFSNDGDNVLKSKPSNLFR